MNNIAKYRGLHNYTQKSLAEELNVTRVAINMMENNKIKTINKKVLSRMCDVLKASPVQLLGADNFKYEPETIEDIDCMIKVLLDLKAKKEK